MEKSASRFPASLKPFAQGLTGVLEISIDHRLLLGSDGEFTSGTPPEVTDTIMSNWDARLLPQQIVNRHVKATSGERIGCLDGHQASVLR